MTSRRLAHPQLHQLTIGWTDGVDGVGTVLDPFGGAGTTGLVADRLGRNAIMIELNPAYAEIAQRRITSAAPMLATVEVAA